MSSGNLVGKAEFVAAKCADNERKLANPAGAKYSR